MTIGKNSRKSSTRSSIRAPKFLDKSNGFYGRLDEPETTGDVEQMRANEVEERGMGDGSGEERAVVNNSEGDEKEEAEAFDYNEGLMEDDGETLLSRKPSRRSSRWRRSSRRKQKVGKTEENVGRDERPSLGRESPVDPRDLQVTIEVEMEKAKQVEEPALVHFPAREDEDDQVLIRDKKRGREEEGEEEKTMKREQEEGMKMLKRNTIKNYRKVRESNTKSYQSICYQRTAEEHTC